MQHKSVTERRFPPRWLLPRIQPRFRVKNAAGQELSDVYYDGGAGQGVASKPLTKGGCTLRIGDNIV
jgi:hypothetical protein